ncbi:MAG: hypothetical protein KF858_08015 [Candidatus Sumerlaeia bacterium]|nr:hypothetical protein [Candidatus Sumerlaeia bacterium]
MPIKHAKQTFTREEIVDILQRNVSLYQNEPGFVAYITDLALYLIDQAYVVAGERPRGLAEQRSTSGVHKLPVLTPTPMPPDVVAAVVALPEPEEPEVSDGDKPTNKMRLQDLQAVIKAPPPPLVEDEDELDPSTDQLRLMGEAASDAPAASRLGQRLVELYTTPPEEELDSAADDPSQADDGLDELDDSVAEDVVPKVEPPTRAHQLPSVGFMTPSQPGGLPGGLTDRDDATRRSRPSSPKLERAKITKPLRPDTRARSQKWVCPVCGTDTKGARICPSCGNIL